MKICMITPEGFPVPAVQGGAVETLVDFLLQENSIEKKMDITMVSVGNQEAELVSKKYENIDFVYIYNSNKLLHKIWKKAYFKIMHKLTHKNMSCYYYQKKIVSKLKDKKFDCVIIEGGDLESYDLLRKKLYTKQFIAHSHGDWVGSEKLKDLYHYHIVISEYAKKNLLSTGLIENKKVQILNNCISNYFFENNISEKEKLEVREKYNIRQDDIVIMFCGRINQDKGVKELLEAFTKMKHKNKCKLLIIGKSQFGHTSTTNFEKEVQKLAEQETERIVFTGFVHNTQLPKLHAISDIATVPSMWNEPSGMVVIEAMASGLPVVTTNSGGIPELITDECGFILERDSNIIYNIASRLDQLVEDENLRQRMGQAGKVRAKEYNKKNYYNHFLEIIMTNKDMDEGMSGRE